MRIGIDGRSLAGAILGGVRNYTACLAPALSRLGHDVYLMADRPLPPIDGVRSSILSSRYGPITYRRLWESAILPLAAKRMDLDVLHFPADVGIPRLKACAYVATIHDVCSLVMPDLFTPRQVVRLRSALIATKHRCDAFVTDSEQSKNDLIRCLGIQDDGRIHVIHLAPRECFRRVLDSDKLQCYRDELGLPERFVLCVGGKNNRHHKNFRGVVEAMASIAGTPEMKDIDLVLVGRESEYIQNVAALAMRLGIREHLVLTGVVDDDTLCALYNLAEVFVFPSLYEGFGLPILEAMACGTPVVTSNHGAMKEVAGDAAVLVDPTSAEEMAESILALLSDRDYRSTVASKGSARVSSFTWDRVARETARVFSSACGHSESR